MKTSPNPTLNGILFAAQVFNESVIKDPRDRWDALIHWVKFARGLFDLGYTAVLLKKTTVYRHDWDLRQPSYEDILRWFGRAIYTGPNAEGFTASAKILAADERIITSWKPQEFGRSEAPRVQEELRNFLEKENRDGATTLRVAVFPLAILFAGAPPRPLPDEVNRG